MSVRTYAESWSSWAWRWFEKRASKPGARWWLFFYSCAETISIPFPADVFMIAILLADTKKWRELAFITTAGSLLGACIGYAIGYFAFESIGKILVQAAHLQAGFTFAQHFIDTQGFWVIFAAALTPLPNVVVPAGFFSLNFFIFFVAWFFGRALRFYGVAYIVYAYGEETLSVFHRYSLIAGVVAGLAFISLFAAAVLGIW